MSHRGVQRRAAVLLLSFTMLVGCANGSEQDADNGETPRPGPEESTRMPQVTPEPREISRLGGDVAVNGDVQLVADRVADRPSRALAARVLRAAGADDVTVTEPGEDAGDAALRVRLGARAAPDVGASLRTAGTDPSESTGQEGYQLAVRDDAETPEIVIGGDDATGVYYGVQTLRQLTSPGKVAGARVVDAPATPLRGTIEGFYGSPWTHEERLNQLAFYGENKLNTYVYAPKDDPYHRERWREPYPPDKLNELRDLIGQAKANHVKFTFAIHPGTSICFSDPDDFRSLREKMGELYDNGVRDFQVLFDDIDYTQWDCAEDEQRYGPASEAAAGQAQADLLNQVQREFIAARPDTSPLQTVPTEYSDMDDSAYKRPLRENLDQEVEVMWTGDGVIPESITVDDAERASEVWGRDPLIWDNYPVNDFDTTAGRLLVGPYAERAPGLSEHITGVVANPMNQAAASKVVETGVADFAWNDADFDPQRAWRAAADQLSGDTFVGGQPGFTADRETSDALMVFFDLNQRAPLADGEPWLPPAPELQRRIDEFHERWDSGDRAEAVRELREYAERIRSAPRLIREGAADDFVADSEPWLAATELWGDSLIATLDGLRGKVDGDERAAREHFDRAQRAMSRAEEVHTIPGETRPQGPVRIADGVLDTFIERAPDA